MGSDGVTLAEIKADPKKAAEKARRLLRRDKMRSAVMTPEDEAAARRCMQLIDDLQAARVPSLRSLEQPMTI